MHWVWIRPSTVILNTHNRKGDAMEALDAMDLAITGIGLILGTLLVVCAILSISED